MSDYTSSLAPLMYEKVMTGLNAGECAAMRRGASNINTLAVGVITFDRNTTSLLDEDIAMIMGQCVISPYCKEGDKIKLRVSGEYPFRDVTTDDTVLDVPGGFPAFRFTTPILQMLSNHELDCTMEVWKGNAMLHQKWHPTSSFIFEPVDDTPGTWRFRLILTGIMSGDSIMEYLYDNRDKFIATQGFTPFPCGGYRRL